MWRKTGQFILAYRFPLLLILIAATALMGYWASKVELSYEFSRAIPVNHPANKTYQAFKQKYGQDGNLLVIGIQTPDLFKEKIFNDYANLHRQLKKVSGVIDVISVPSAVNLVKQPETEKLNAVNIFPEKTLSQPEIDSSAAVFRSLPFYQHLLYNPQTNAWMMGVSIDKVIMNSKKRNGVVAAIRNLAESFGKNNNQEVYLSGLPLIRTEIATRIADEMKWFLFASVVLSALILLLFFRSFSAMLLSLGVVIIGVVWSMATIHLCGYKITLLTALIPPLIVVIGIPNCIYFLNKYHTAYNDTGDRKEALITMVSRMGIVTLFCNLAAAIGFAVFALTRSEILQEFGVVAGINIMALFFISLVLIPVTLSYLPAPKSRHTKYLHNPRLNRWLDRLERWSLNHRKLIYIVTLIIIAFSIAGIFRLKSVGYIVDDLPKTDKIYTDLKFFEKNFKGVMPLEILVDTKKKYGVSRNLTNLLKIDSLSQYLATMPEIARPLSIAEGLKFAKQAFFEGDSANYSMPAEYDLPALAQYLSFKSDTGTAKNSFSKLVSTFMDTARQEARISISMADVGSAHLPEILDSVNKKVDQLFPKEKYTVQLTGTSITFLEGSSFIINGLKESVFWAFLLIALCMLYLFKSVRILLCSLIPNIIPLIITAGVMGWAGIPLKPSTVLVFSVALGIAIDITIRFLVNYKQELPHQQFDVKDTVIETIHSTGISIIYTSLVLIAGFIIFSFSGFGGTQALGWLTSLTLVTATFTNLVLLPALLINLIKNKKRK
ncbi:efflux RND transporter permease subunit [Terrimonas pollutisoli]|uniref:efflux RND transporter permease subunit n=1 Tax=Terrimonas pollutisoli TaxID=3034147 RepID=UPI0023ED9302|nr:efflux RND transporter permease subunit [Terrimonas sp. H1YJ31]